MTSREVECHHCTHPLPLSGCPPSALSWADPAGTPNQQTLPGDRLRSQRADEHPSQVTQQPSALQKHAANKGKLVHEHPPRRADENNLLMILHRDAVSRAVAHGNSRSAVLSQQADREWNADYVRVSHYHNLRQTANIITAL